MQSVPIFCPAGDFFVPNFDDSLDSTRSEDEEATQPNYEPRSQRTMDEGESIDHHTISPTLIVALAVLICLIVLPNALLAPTNPKDKAE